MQKRTVASPPRPELIRHPTSRFGWIEDRLLHDGMLARLGAEGTSVLVLLALAADRHGASFYGRKRMAAQLSLSRPDVDNALRRLLELRLVAHPPWRPEHPDGIWQLLPLPTPQPRGGEAVSPREVFQSLGLPLPGASPHAAATPPDSHTS